MSATPLVLLAVLATTGYDAVRELPCTTYEHEQAILATLRKHPMTAESYGVVRNIVAPRKGDFFGASLPEWWTYAEQDEWHAAQAFIVELSPPHESDGFMVFSEPFLSVSHMMYDLGRMLAKMRPPGSDRPTPYTAFLALAERVANEPNRGTNDAEREALDCQLAGDAGRLLVFLGEPEPEFRTRAACRDTVDHFRAWLRQHRHELQAEAAKEAEAVGEARDRMNRVTLCRAPAPVADERQPSAVDPAPRSAVDAPPPPSALRLPEPP